MQFDNSFVYVLKPGMFAYIDLSSHSKCESKAAISISGRFSVLPVFSLVVHHGAGLLFDDSV